MSPRDSKKAVVVGPYRVHNFGDDLVGAIIAKHLQREGYRVTVPRLESHNAEWIGAEYAASYDGVFDDADIVVVGGGGIMSDTSGAKPGASYLDVVAKAGFAGYLNDKKVLVTSVGAGPWLLERSKMLAFGVSLLADKIGVRDQESYDHLQSIGVSGDKVILGSDCALLSAEYLNFKPKNIRKMGIQFNVGQFADTLEAPNLGAISRAVQEYVNGHEPNVVLVSNGRGKSPLAKEASSAETLRYTDLQNFLPRLAGLTSIFTSHLHLAITAFSQRIPTFSLYVREKTKRFYDQVGRPERAIDLRVATVEDFKRFIEAAETATWSDQDEEALQKLQSQARTLLDFVK